MISTTRKYMHALAACSAIGLAGCSGYGLDHYETASLMPETTPNAGFEHTIVEEVPLSRAFVLFPSAVGEPVGVFENSFSNGIEQKIVYYGEPSTPGENFIEIRAVRGGGKSKAGTNALTLHNNSASELRTALRAVMPNAKMSFSPLVENNAYGTFGYALGKEYDGQNCMFAWQSIQGHVKAFDGLFRWARNDKRSISVRARLCRGAFSAQNLVSMMRGLRIVLDPKDLEKREVVRWHGKGQGINSFGRPEEVSDGYVTEGLAVPNIDPVQDFPDAPVVRSPVVRSTAPARVTSAAPTRTTTPSVRQTAPKAVQPKVTPRPKVEREPNYMERQDLLSNDSNKELQVQTIYVDPRQYATVPAPDDTNNSTAIRPSVGQVNGFNTPASTAGRVAPIRRVGETGTRAQGLVPGPSDPFVDQDAFGGTDLNTDVQSDQAGRKGDSDPHTVVMGRAGLPPEARPVKTSEWDRSNNSSAWDGGQSGWSGSEGERENDNKKAWVNDVARNDQTGIPLGRPCGIIRDSNCKSY